MMRNITIKLLVLVVCMVTSGALIAQPCTITCPPDQTVTVDPVDCVGYVTMPRPTLNGNCAASVALLDPNNEDYTQWTATTTSTASTTPGACGVAAFSITCTTGYPSSAGSGGPPPSYDDTQLVIDDDAAGSGVDGIHCFESPVLDMSGGGISLAFDWEFEALLAGEVFSAEAWNGASWDVLFSLTAGPDAFGSENISLGAYNNNDFQVRFCFDDNGTFSWGASIDNVEVLAAAPGAVATNDYNGTADIINESFPVGTTTVTWSVFDASGNIQSCMTDVTVVDPGPSIVCPDDVTFTLDPGACCVYHHYDVDFFTCDPILTAGASLDMNTSVPGGTGQVGVNFDLENTTGSPQTIESFDIFLDAGTWNISLYYTTGNTYNNVYNVGTAFANSAEWIYVGSEMLTSAGTASSVNLPLGFTIPANSCKGVYIVSDVGQAGGPIKYAINVGNSTSNNGTSVFNAGIGRSFTAGTMHFDHAIFGAQSGTACTPTANFRAPLGTVNYAAPTGNAVTQIAGLPSGSCFPVGTTVNTFVAEDASGRTDTCSFTVNVEPFPNPTTDFACNDVINLSPDADCEVLVTADLILEGGPYGCYDDYVITLTTLNGDPVPNPVPGSYIPGQIRATVTDTATGATCWGLINLEDKQIPDLECDSYEFDCDDDITAGVRPLGAVNYDVTQTPGSLVTAGIPTEIEFPVSLSGTLSEVTDVNISFDISHTWIGDLQVQVESPSGTVVDVINNIGGPGFGCDADNIIVTMDDQAASTYADLDAMCNPTPPAASGTFQPISMLSAFNGEEAGGTWIVRVIDLAFGDDGNVNSVNLQVNANASSGVPFPLPDSPGITVSPAFGDGPFIVSGFDGCGDVTLTYTDEEIDLDCTDGSGFTGLVLRSWTAVDKGNNVVTCTDTIRLRAATFATIDLPVDRDNVDAPALECNGAWDVGCDGIPNTGDAGEGDNYPQPCELGDEISALCDIWASYWDHEDIICGDSRKIFRDWRIVDKCTGEFIEYTQLIFVLDSEGPEIYCPDEIEIPTDPYTCTATWQVEPPIASDECSGIASWSVTSAAGTVINFGGVWTISGLPEGCTEVTYTVVDGCGNESTCVTEVCVVDLIPPVAICDVNTQVSLGADGRARIFAETFNDGSYDNCGIDRIEVRRSTQSSCYSPPIAATFWAPYVEFCCDDIQFDGDGNPIPVIVEMRVTDYEGNSNICWVNVVVEDKLPPVIVCPPDITVSCDFKFDLNDLSSTFGRVALPGEIRNDIYIDDIDYQEDCLGFVYSGPQFVGKDGYATDNCNVTVTEIVNADLECGQGVITRIFTATDDNGRSDACLQFITIVDCDPFEILDTDSRCRDRGGFYTTQDDVEWPCDVTLDGCSGAQTSPDFTGRPIYEDDKCSLVADTFYDEVFTVVDSACFKILRHWSIIDWCQEDFNGLPLRWDYTQVIKVIDEDEPIITPAAPSCDSNATDCAGYTDLFPTVEDCTPEDHLIFWWRIDAYNDGVGPIPGGYDFQGGTDFGGGIDPSGVYPYGTHRILWVIEDMCGNRGTVEYTFDVEDCKKPSPVCINGLSSVVMPSSGEITVWAVDFDASSFDNCDTDLDFRIWYSYMDSVDYPDQSRDWRLPTASTSGDDVLFYLPTGAVFYCDAIGNGVSETFTVRIYVVDDYGNWDYCTTNITIDDNDDVCPDDTSSLLQIVGTYRTEVGEVIDEVMTTMDAEKGADQYTRNQMVDEDGRFKHVTTEGFNVDVYGEKDDAYLNGVTAQDLSLIQRHVAGIEFLNSNYKQVAADADRNAQINIADVLALRKLLLGIDDVLPQQQSWVTIDADYTFPGITNTTLPADVYEQDMISYQNVTQNMMETDFIGVKIGDVDGDAKASSLASGDTRSGGDALTLTATDVNFAGGELVSFDVTAENFDQVTAYQFTFGFDRSVMEFVGVEAGALQMNANNFGTQQADRGLVTTVWYSATAQTFAADEVLFTLTFRANAAGSLSSVINIGSAITEAMAFNAANGQTDVDIQFNTEAGEVVGDAFALYQNEPNPFNDVTTIGYVLPESAEATLSIYDMSGRVLTTATVDGQKGYNNFIVKRSELPTSGVLYYQVETDDYAATKKMVVVE